jgi:MFS transporter, DHA2 family, methylenomycin A resistance protein
VPSFRRSGRPTALGTSSTASLVVAVLGFFVTTLDTTIVTVTLSAIGDDLGGDIGGLQWVVDGYFLTFAAMLLAAGAASDRFGARRAFGSGLVVFVLSSAACAVAPTLTVLIGARLGQGLGAALMTPASLALLREAFPEARARARAIGIWALGGAVAAASAPLLGGALSVLSWRWIFLINLPVGAVAFALLSRVTPSDSRRVAFDWMGQILSLLALSTLTYAAIEGGRFGFGRPDVSVAMLVFVVSAALFLASQRRAGTVMMPLDLFSSRPVVVAVCSGFTTMAGYFGMVFTMSLLLQKEYGLSPLATGLVFLPMTSLLGVTNVLSGRVTARFGPKLPMVAGQLVGTAAYGAMGFSVGHAPTLLLAALMIPIGLAGAFAVPALTAMLMDTVPIERVGTALGVLNTSRQVGGALAVAVFGALMIRYGFTTGASISMLIAGGLLLSTTLSTLLLPGQGGAEITAAGEAVPQGTACVSGG